MIAKEAAIERQSLEDAGHKVFVLSSEIQNQSIQQALMKLMRESGRAADLELLKKR